MTEGKVIKLTADEITETHGDTVFQFVTKALETQDEFIFETIRPFCETQAHMAITKDELIRALTLLREQEPVKPRWFTDVHHPAGAFVCGACRERIVEKNFDFYCPKCGKAVKWDA